MHEPKEIQLRGSERDFYASSWTPRERATGENSHLREFDAGSSKNARQDPESTASELRICDLECRGPVAFMDKVAF